MSLSVNNLYKKYAKYIASNAETCSDIELLTKYLGYFVGGKFSDNFIFTEGILSLSNLLVIANDQIIRKEVYKQQFRSANINSEEHKIKLFLTVIENVEVLLECCSKKVLGDKRRFIIIFIIQALKTICRLVLVLKFKNRISQSPAIQYLDRKNLLKTQPGDEFPNETNTSSITLKLKRSGKTIRKVSQTPSLYSRSFMPPPNELEENDRFGGLNHKAIKNAELVYILKPMMHLGAVGLFGYKSWKSYTLSMFLDVYSIYQYYKYRNYMTRDQKKELSRRCVNMLLYILRSPLYDKYSHDKIDALMRAASNKIPFAKLIVEPYRAYIPKYQDTYFYMFSN